MLKTFIESTPVFSSELIKASLGVFGSSQDRQQLFERSFLWLSVTFLIWRKLRCHSLFKSWPSCLTEGGCFDPSTQLTASKEHLLIIVDISANICNSSNANLTVNIYSEIYTVLRLPWIFTKISTQISMQCKFRKYLQWNIHCDRITLSIYTNI